MSQVGTIKGYHDGSTYSLADIYDEKLTEYNILAGTSAKEIVSVSFDSTSGIVWSYDSDMATATNPNIFFLRSDTTIASTGNATMSAKIIPYLSADHAAEGVALNISAASSHWLQLPTFVIVPKIQDASGNYVKSIRPSHEFEGRFFIDTSKSATQNKWNSPRALFSIPEAISTTSANTTTKSNHYHPRYAYDDSTAEIYMSNYDTADYTYVRTLDRSVFDSPFHLRLQWLNSVDNPKYVWLCYVNGELYFYMLRPADAEDTEVYYCQWDHIAIGAYRSYNATTKKYGTSNFAYISVTDFKASLLSPVYQKISVPGNMLIRHNNANCYIPLTTNKANTSTPCLAVRHGNTNYYAIK